MDFEERPSGVAIPLHGARPIVGSGRPAAPAPELIEFVRALAREVAKVDARAWDDLHVNLDEEPMDGLDATEDAG